MDCFPLNTKQCSVNSDIWVLFLVQFVIKIVEFYFVINFKESSNLKIMFLWAVILSLHLTKIFN